MYISNNQGVACKYARLQLSLIAATLVVFATFLLAGTTRAHELNPAIANIEIGKEGALQLELALNLEALIAGIGPEHESSEEAPQSARYDALRQLGPDELAAQFDAFEPRFLSGLTLTSDEVVPGLSRVSVSVPEVGDTGVIRRSALRYAAQLPQGANALTWRYDAAFGPVVLRVTRAGESMPFYANLLAPGAVETIAISGLVYRATTSETLLRYIRLGFDHILPKGLDHVLFIMGLFLLSARLKPLLLQVTTFTLAHSVTLAMGLAGWINVPGSIVEPLIALSIVFVAVENIFTQNLHRWRMAIVFGFGLLHGLGFAGVLRELSVEGGQFAASLIGFNIGVELGQIAVVMLCYAVVGYWFGSRAWYHTRIVVPASLVIAVIAGYWFFERVGVIA